MRVTAEMRLPRQRTRALPLDPLEVCAWLFTLAEAIVLSPLADAQPLITGPLEHLLGSRALLIAMCLLAAWQGAGIAGLLSGRVRRAGWMAGTLVWLWAVSAGALTTSIGSPWTLLVPVALMNAWTYRRAKARGTW